MLRKRKLVSILFILFFVIASVFFPYDLFLTLKDDMFVTTDELNELIKDNWIVAPQIVSVNAKDDSDFDKYIINYIYSGIS